MKKLLLLLVLLAGIFTGCSAKDKNEATTETIVVQGVNSTKPSETATQLPTTQGSAPVATKTETATQATTTAPSVDSTSSTSTSKVNGNSKFFYTTVFNIPIMDAPTGGKKIDTLRKNTRVTILEEKTVGDKTPVNYAKIQFTKDKKIGTGWIRKSNLTSDYMENLPKTWGKIDLTPMKKVSYPDNPRKEVRGIYVSATSISSSKSLDRLIALTKKSKINAFVIDVKNDDGHLLWKMEDITSKYGVESDKRSPLKDINSLMAKLKENNIYAIARIVSFKDPTYSKAKPNRTIIDKRNGKPFTNADGLIWVSAYDRELWQYNIDVAKAAAKAGFNEIQFDYVRFPASNGGKLDAYLDYRNTNNESKPVAIQHFLESAHKQLSPLQVYTAADVYGQVGSSPDDMALGQYWEAVSNVVDYICPMAYPSHYGNGVYGVAIPDANSYKTVYESTRDSINRNANIDSPAIIRTWIQDFTAPWVKGHIKYGVNEVNAQIKALNDLGIKEYILWNAGNRYSFEKE